MVRVTIKSVGPSDQITFSVDDVVFTVSRTPKLRLVDHLGSQVLCPNFNEWIAKRTTGFYQAHHLQAMAEAFKAGTTVKVKPSDLKKCADGVFNVVKRSLFLDGTARYYVEYHPLSILSQAEIGRKVVESRESKDDTLGAIESALYRICQGRGYTRLAEVLEARGKPQATQQQVTSERGDLVIQSLIGKYLDGSV